MVFKINNMIWFYKICSVVENNEVVSELKRVHEKEKDILQEENRKLGQEVDRVSFYFITSWYDKIKGFDIKAAITALKILKIFKR